MENDHQDIRRVLSGNREAFTAIVDRHRGYVFTVCLNVLKNREEAEEAAQDTFLKVFKTLRSYKGESKFSTWLYRIAFRTAIDKGRRKKRDISPLNENAESQFFKDEAATPLELAEGSSLKSALEKVLASMPEAVATVLDLYYLHEQSVKEISNITGLSLSNVKVKLHRGRDVLKRKLSLYLKEEIKDLI